MQNSENRTSRSDDTHSLPDRIQQLEGELERLKTRKHQLQFSTVVSYTLLLIGAVALITSTLYASLVPAFIGLALTFWGALLLYIKPQKYVRANLLNSTTIPLLKTINQIMIKINVQEKAIHLPPRDLTELKGGKVFVPIKNETNPSLTTKEETQEKNNPQNPYGIYLSPTGLGLVNLFENELGTDFNKVDLNYLINNLPKLFIENLEIAEDFEMTTENNMVHVKITESIYQSLCNEISNLPNICNSFGCPLCSSIACALAKVTGKPIIIEKNGQSKDGKTIEVSYRIIEE